MSGHWSGRPDPDIDETYEKLIGEFRAKHVQSLEGKVVIRGDEERWVQNRNAKAGDVVALPIRAHGIDYQHLNDDPNRPVKFIVAMTNAFEVLGIDLGGRFEQVEDCPEYAVEHAVT